jgi:hypothetical protein
MKERTLIVRKMKMKIEMKIQIKIKGNYTHLHAINKIVQK